MKVVNKILSERYDTDAWNVYCVQASDGDNYSTDNIVVKAELDILVPKCQYFVYDEVLQANNVTTNLMSVMKTAGNEHRNFSIIQTHNVEEVVPSFRQVFTKKEKHAK